MIDNTSGVINENVEARLILDYFISEFADGFERSQIKMTDDNVHVP
jgi:hypothetical protein